MPPFYYKTDVRIVNVGEEDSKGKLAFNGDG
jgi:hypothetical protein